MAAPAAIAGATLSDRWRIEQQPTEADTIPPVRRLITVTSALSLLLCMCTCALWVRSHGTYDQIRWADPAGRLWVTESGNGKLLLGTIRQWPCREPLNWQSATEERNPEGLPLFSYGNADPTCYSHGGATVDGFSPSWGEGVARLWYRTDGVPPQPGQWSEWFGPSAGIQPTAPLAYYEREVFHGAFALLFALLGGSLLVLRLAVGSVMARRARRFQAARLCPSCGYDLRATPNCCPECGAVPEREAVA